MSVLRNKIRFIINKFVFYNWKNDSKFVEYEREFDWSQISTLYQITVCSQFSVFSVSPFVWELTPCVSVTVSRCSDHMRPLTPKVFSELLFTTCSRVQRGGQSVSRGPPGIFFCSRSSFFNLYSWIWFKINFAGLFCKKVKNVDRRTH